MTSGLAQRSPFLVQTMAHVFGREIEVPAIDNATAVGAAIHGAVACGRVRDFREGAAAFGAQSATTFRPDPATHAIYRRLFATYKELSRDQVLKDAMLVLDLTPVGEALERPLGRTGAANLADLAAGA